MLSLKALDLPYQGKQYVRTTADVKHSPNKHEQTLYREKKLGYDIREML